MTLRAITEQQFQGQIIDFAHILGYRVAHFRPAQTSRGWRTPVQADGKGFPDLILAKPGRVLALEVKTAKGKLSPEQTAWLTVLADAGVYAAVVRPGDWDSIVAYLSGREGVAPVTEGGA